MAFIGKPEYSASEGYLQLNLSLWDENESCNVSFTQCKVLVAGDIAYIYGKASSITGMDDSKLVTPVYIEVHNAKYKAFKEEKEPSAFEAELFKKLGALETEQTYKGKVMLNIQMVEMIDQMILLKESDKAYDLPEFKPKGRSFGGQQKSYGMTPEQRLEFISKQLGCGATTTEIYFKIIGEFPNDGDYERVISLLGLILR